MSTWYNEYIRDTSRDTLLDNLPNILYTATTTLALNTTLYDNTGTATSYVIATIDQDGQGFNVLSDVTLTINTSDSPVSVNSIILTADGYTQVGNSITVPYGTEVTWQVGLSEYTKYKKETEVLTHTYTKYVNVYEVQGYESMQIHEIAFQNSTTSELTWYERDSTQDSSSLGYGFKFKRTQEESSQNWPNILYTRTLYFDSPSEQIATYKNTGSFFKYISTVSAYWRIFTNIKDPITAGATSFDIYTLNGDKVLADDSYIQTDIYNTKGIYYENKFYYPRDFSSYTRYYVITSDSVPLVTLTVNTNPADATVMFNKGIVSGHDCIVNSGEVVMHTISKANYRILQSLPLQINTDTIVNAPYLGLLDNGLVSESTSDDSCDMGSVTDSTIDYTSDMNY